MRSGLKLRSSAVSKGNFLQTPITLQGILVPSEGDDSRVFSLGFRMVRRLTSLVRVVNDTSSGCLADWGVNENRKSKKPAEARPEQALWVG
jgi:hypothetical protein